MSSAAAQSTGDDHQAAAPAPADSPRIVADDQTTADEDDEETADEIPIDDTEEFDPGDRTEAVKHGWKASVHISGNASALSCILGDFSNRFSGPVAPNRITKTEFKLWICKDFPTSIIIDTGLYTVATDQDGQPWDILKHSWSIRVGVEMNVEDIVTQPVEQDGEMARMIAATYPAGHPIHEHARCGRLAALRFRTRVKNVSSTNILSPVPSAELGSTHWVRLRETLTRLLGDYETGDETLTFTVLMASNIEIVDEGMQAYRASLVEQRKSSPLHKYYNNTSRHSYYMQPNSLAYTPIGKRPRPSIPYMTSFHNNAIKCTVQQCATFNAHETEAMQREFNESLEHSMLVFEHSNSRGRVYFAVIRLNQDCSARFDEEDELLITFTSLAADAVADEWTGMIINAQIPLVATQDLMLVLVRPFNKESGSFSTNAPVIQAVHDGSKWRKDDVKARDALASILCGHEGPASAKNTVMIRVRDSARLKAYKYALQVCNPGLIIRRRADAPVERLRDAGAVDTMDRDELIARKDAYRKTRARQDLGCDMRIARREGLFQAGTQPLVELARLFPADRYNDSQKRAFEATKAVPDRMMLIQGPPATGKTMVVTRLTALAVKQGMQVMIVGPSNQVVDTITARAKQALESAGLYKDGTVVRHYTTGITDKVKDVEMTKRMLREADPAAPPTIAEMPRTLTIGDDMAEYSRLPLERRKSRVVADPRYTIPELSGANILFRLSGVDKRPDPPQKRTLRSANVRREYTEHAETGFNWNDGGVRGMDPEDREKHRAEVNAAKRQRLEAYEALLTEAQSTLAAGDDDDGHDNAAAPTNTTDTTTITDTTTTNPTTTTTTATPTATTTATTFAPAVAYRAYATLVSMNDERELTQEEQEALHDTFLGALSHVYAGASVVTTTAVAAYEKVVSRAVRPQLIIVDEAAQVSPMDMVVLTALFPTAFFVQVGDVTQLAPFEHDVLVNTFGEWLNRSHMWRLQTLQWPAHLLEESFRFGKEILGLVNMSYDDVLTTSVTAQQRPLAATCRQVFKDDFGVDYPVMFLDVTDTEDSKGLRNSKRNAKEAECMLAVGMRLERAGVEPRQITYLVGYDAQARLLRAQVLRRSRSARMAPSVVATIDSYQGAENEVVIFGVTGTSSLGFLAIANRINVAVSRPRSALVVVANWTKIRRCAKGSLDARLLGKVYRYCKERSAVSEETWAAMRPMIKRRIMTDNEVPHMDNRDTGGWQAGLPARSAVTHIDAHGTVHADEHGTVDAGAHGWGGEGVQGEGDASGPADEGDAGLQDGGWGEGVPAGGGGQPTGGGGGWDVEGLEDQEW